MKTFPGLIYGHVGLLQELSVRTDTIGQHNNITWLGMVIDYSDGLYKKFIKFSKIHLKTLQKNKKITKTSKINFLK